MEGLTKVCIGCNDELPITSFQITKLGRHYNYCKKCRKDKSDIKRWETVERRITPKPHTYKDKQQKEDVFLFLQAMGWSFNHERKLWFKEGIVTAEGIWKK